MEESGIYFTLLQPSSRSRAHDQPWASTSGSSNVVLSPSEAFQHVKCISRRVGEVQQQHHCSGERWLNFGSLAGTQLPLPKQWAGELKGGTRKKVLQEGRRHKA